MTVPMLIYLLVDTQQRHSGHGGKPIKLSEANQNKLAKIEEIHVVTVVIYYLRNRNFW